MKHAHASGTRHSPPAPGPILIRHRGNTLQKSMARGPAPLPPIPGKPLGKTLVFLGNKGTGQNVQTI